MFAFCRQSQDSDRPYLDILRPYSAHTCDPKDETYRVEDIGLPTAVQTGDRIEALIPAADDRADGVRLEAVDHDLDNPHIGDPRAEKISDGDCGLTSILT